MKAERNFQEILFEALDLVRDVPVYFGATHLAQCDKVYRTVSRFEPFNDVMRENARYACVMLAGVGQSSRIRAMCGFDEQYAFADVGDITATFVRRLCDGEIMKDTYPVLVEAIKPHLDSCLEGLRDWSKEHPVTSLGRWIASVRQMFSAEEMWAIAIYSNKGEPSEVVNQRFVLPFKDQNLPYKWADEMYRIELLRLSQVQDSNDVRKLVATYRLLDPANNVKGGTFNGTISKYTAANILRDYEWLVAVFGDFDIEEVEGASDYYYFCGSRKVLELYR